MDPIWKEWTSIMQDQSRLPLACLCLWAILVAGCSSSPPPAFHVETTIHADSTCDRLIWQPKEQFLPAQALKPEWNALWKSVSDASGRPGLSDTRAGDDPCKYFIARGSFTSPRDIPPHYYIADDKVPDAGASELERTYERNDYGFVVEHRWNEKLTNIVTFRGFLKARDELLDLFLPGFIEVIEKVFGTEYDVSRLANHLRTNGRRAIENICLIVYDVAAHRPVTDENGKLVAALTEQLYEEAERFGLDRKVLAEIFADRSVEKEFTPLLKAYLGRLVVQYFRHRDGTALSAAEVDSLIQAVFTTDRYQKAFQEESKRIEERLKKDKQLEKRVGRAILQMVGLYGVFRFPILIGPPEYEFSIVLPGEIIETNGTGMKAGRTRWKFTGVGLFPDGFEMRARSIVIDRDGQKKVLGRVAIDDESQAIAFMEAVGREGPLLEAVRKFRQTGDRKALSEVRTETQEERLRARKLREMLFNE
jgi:hypothetical protein